MSKQHLSFQSSEHSFSAVTLVKDFRRNVVSAKQLTNEQRMVLVDQALILFNDIYVHLPLKKAMYATDPVQRLRRLKAQLSTMSEFDFHTELLGIFTSVRDLHTNYVLPSPYNGKFAFMGILVERFENNGMARWIVSKIADKLVTSPDLKPGVEVTHWNGMPMEMAVYRNGQKEAGSNEAARMARGLENMTFRSLATSFMPDEDWVDLVFVANGQQFETRLDWFIFDGGAELATTSSDPNSLFDYLIVPLRHQIAIDWRTEDIRHIKKQLFNPVACETEKQAKSNSEQPLSITEEQAAAGIIPTTRPDDVTAKLINTPFGEFGYLKLWTFHMRDGDINGYLNEMIRLLSRVFPADGLIIDVRGNGGGYVIAAEFLLQLLTPHRIQPQPSQFINTPATRALTAETNGMTDWHDSLVQGLSTGSQYSKGIALSSNELVNFIGQVYHGPVVLITDAFCYSACDMFAAGFKDHDIGVIIGVDDATGAGGANVLDHESLRQLWVDGPLQKLPNDAQMRVSLRRTLRVGELAGQPVEDLGILPDKRVELTKNDLLNGNEDLLNTAAQTLSQMPTYTLVVEHESDGHGAHQLRIESQNLSEVDVYVNGRPVTSHPLVDGETLVSVELPNGDVAIRLEGFNNGALVAARDLRIN